MLSTLEKDFLSNYPAELLSADVLPGPRMLAWLRRNLQDKQWRFCAWKYRLSLKAHEVRPSAGPLRRPGWSSKTCCSRSSPPGQWVLRWGCISLAAFCTCIQGIALQKGAQHRVLKDYDRAFLSKAAFRFPPNLGLRGPNPEEMEFADQQLWKEIGDLCEQGWSMDKGS